jgi:hypothetical protein
MPTATPSRTSKPRKRRVRLNLSLHPGQREVYDSPARFKVVACGRQWGKSKFASAWVLERVLAGKAGWWIAPDANVALIGWDMLKGLFQQIPGVEIAEAKRLITAPGGGWVQVKGAHNEGKLRGRTLDFIVNDEAAFVHNGGNRWNAELRPTLAVKNGEALFVSTFNGENWFYDLYELGQNADEPEWESWRKPSTENPYFPAAELERARRTTPQAEFEQEYLANPLVYVGAVFPGEKVQEAAERPTREGTAFAGLDWGYTNATAFEVCTEDAEGRISWVYEKLWVATQIETRVGQIVAACMERNIEAIYADAAGADENAMLAEWLGSAGAKTMLVPVPFGKFKEGGIKARRWYLEQGLESMDPRVVPELLRTTKRYRYKEGTDDVVKEDDHPVDAATAFYASRRGVVVGG